jgi:GNAT superfamily N-acetyltransferase
MAQALGRLMRSLGLEAGLYWVCFLDLRGQPPGKALAPSGVELREVTAEEVACASDALMADQDWYGGKEALGYGAFRDQELVGLQWIWFGDRYREQRGFWPLDAGEAKSVQLVTVPRERGSGIATALKAYSASDLRARGFTGLYSRIWWNNESSLRVSAKSGWRRVALVAILGHRGRGRCIQATLPLARPWLRRARVVSKPRTAL